METRDKPFKIVVLLSGRGSNLKALYHRIKEFPEHLRIVLVVSDIAEAQGVDFAQSVGIPTAIVPKIKADSREEFTQKIITAINQSDPDLVVLAGFMKILSANFVNAFAAKIINIHPSLLPKFPGLKPQAQALAAKELQSGATVHFVNEQVDAGPIIAQAVVPIFENDNEELLAQRILEKEHILLPGVVLSLAKGYCSLERDGKVYFTDDCEFNNDPCIRLTVK